MGKRAERIKQSSIYRHADVWTGGTIGTIFQGMETHPEIFDYATGDLFDIPAQLFEEEINSWNGDKLIHATAFYTGWALAVSHEYHLREKEGFNWDCGKS